MGSDSTLVNVSTVSHRQFDYVIVGGGTAGCVLANRLSEDPSISVLLVEAGKSHKDELFSKIPLTFGKLFKGQHDWNYETTPQAALDGRKLFWPRGKMLGGCSSINAMMYHHAAPQDFDQWATDAPGWSYATMRPYFRKSEKYTSNALHADINPSHRGTDGLWHTGYPPRPKVCDDVLESFKAVGVPYNPDFNTPAGTLGANHFPGFIDARGQRSSAATAYITPLLKKSRKNLRIVLQATTTRLLFSTDSAKVIGVELANTPSAGKPAGPERFVVFAGREVIVSAGAINTPQILKLSGLGPESELKRHGIPVIRDIPQLGYNLMDHIMSGAIPFRAVPKTSLDYLGTPLGSLIPLVRWLATGGGMLGALVGAGAAFVRSDDESLPYGSEASLGIATQDVASGPGAPDIEILWAPMAFIDHGFQPAPPGTEVISLAPTLLRPVSRGKVTLASSDPFSSPIMDANYFAEPNDMNVLIKAVRLSLRVARSDPLRRRLDFRPRSQDPNDVFWLGDSDPDTITDSEIREWIKSHCETLYHPVGTARMGSSPETSVVDPSLRVHGFENLRIVDASVFPHQISGHPTATVIAIAERMADVIKAQYFAKA